MTAATVTRRLGKCPLCEGDFKLDASALMVHHGYERPGDGAIHGDCAAVGHPPYEVSCEVTKTHLRVRSDSLADRRGRLACLKAGEATSLLVTRERWSDGRTTRELIEVTPASPEWASALETAVWKCESEIHALEREVARLSRLVDEWEPRPLRTVEELEGPRKAERDAARAKREADRAARLAARVKSYQDRIDRAVAQRKAKPIAEAFEAIPRALYDLGAKRREEAFALVDRSAVFAAFGLDERGAWGRADNQWRLACMTWDPEGLLRWPAALGGPSEPDPLGAYGLFGATAREVHLAAERLGFDRRGRNTDRALRLACVEAELAAGIEPGATLAAVREAAASPKSAPHDRRTVEGTGATPRATPRDALDACARAADEREGSGS